MNPKDTEAMIELLKKELGPLADALGQGAGKTFEIFVRQAWVNAFQNLLWIPVGLVVFILGMIMFRSGNKKDKYGSSEWQGAEWLILSAAIGISLLAILLPITYLIQVKINPDYAALNLMLDTFRTAK